MESTPKMFLYNAHAHGVSGEFQRPIKQIIEAQAATSLSTAGGHGRSRADKFKFVEFLSFDSAYSHVSGSKSETDGNYSTLATATVEGLNILDVVTARRVVARLSSERNLQEPESHIIFLGSRFEDLRIAGCPVEVILDLELFHRADTFSNFKKEFDSNADFRKMAQDPFQAGQSQKSPDPSGVFLCSLVKDIKTTCPGVKREGHGLVIPQFGKVFFAEVVIEHQKRTLTMIRAELGCPVTGGVVTAMVQGNGRPWP
jgi:hypothetical protein